MPDSNLPSTSGEMPGEKCECLLLSEALRNHKLQVVKDFLNRRQNATTAWIDPFETPVQKACTCSQLEVVKKLLLDEMMTANQIKSENIPPKKEEKKPMTNQIQSENIPPKKEEKKPMTNQNVSEGAKDTYCESLKLDIAAGNGSLKIVKDLCENNTELLELENSARYVLAIPVVRASNAGHGEVTRYLYENTDINVLMDDEGYWATCLLLDAIFYGFLDIALTIFKNVRSDQVQSLAVTKQARQRSSPLRFLALKPDLFPSHCNLGFWRHLIYKCIHLDRPTNSSRPNQYQRRSWISKLKGIKHIYELKDRHSEAQNLLKIICLATQGMVKDESWKATVYEALLEAVENGNKEFFIEIIQSNRELLWISKASSGRNLFQLAVEFRKEKIFNLIYGLDDIKATLLRSYDKDNNNILHIAAYPSPLDHLYKVSGSALQMQRAAQWFEEVKSLVSEREVVQKNKYNKTPRQVFEESYEPLRKEGEEWMKYTATACSFVAALIATVTFQAIFTVPGGSDETSGKPLLLMDLHFTAFIMADTLAFFSSCTSVLIFLSILTARYSFDDFIVSLPRKMIFALTFLFISIWAMLVAFITALSASMRERPTLVVPLKPLASFPGLLFLMLQYPLLKEMISSTYGRGFFSRDTQKWYDEE